MERNYEIDYECPFNWERSYNSAEDAEETEGALQLGIQKDIYTSSTITTDAKVHLGQYEDDLGVLMQLNSKFVNNMLPEWSRFITEVKLNRGLKESNFDQLYAYLKQHEVHANENRMMMERFIQPIDDPLALVSNASNQKYPTQSSESPQFSNQPSLVDNCQMDTGSTSTDNLIESITNTLALLRTSSNARNNATVQDGRVVVQDVRGRYNANNQGRPFQRNNARGNVVAGNVGECPQPKRPQDLDYFKDKMLLMQAQESGVVLHEEQLLFLAGERATNFDDEWIQEKDNVISDLKVLVSNMNDRSCEPYNANDVTDLLEQNKRLRAEIEKVKQHYKEMFESIKITRTSTNEQTSSLLNR
ncbi:hypothetical protein Tco_1491374 [Tanacetum coccineum]